MRKNEDAPRDRLDELLLANLTKNIPIAPALRLKISRDEIRKCDVERKIKNAENERNLVNLCRNETKLSETKGSKVVRTLLRTETFFTEISVAFKIKREAIEITEKPKRLVKKIIVIVTISVITVILIKR